MDVKQFDAANAYGAALKNINSPGVVGGDKVGLDPTSQAQPQESVFSSLISQSIGDVAKSSGDFEKTTAQVLTGKASVVDVVTAASKAEIAVKTVVGVRDKVIQAYQEIMKMPL